MLASLSREHEREEGSVYLPRVTPSAFRWFPCIETAPSETGFDLVVARVLVPSRSQKIA